MIPKANVTAISAGNRPYNNDLNRQFPADGSECKTKLATKIWHVLDVWDPDHVFTLHSSPGIYHSPDLGDGQSIFPTDHGSARKYATQTVELIKQYELSFGGDEI